MRVRGKVVGTVVVLEEAMPEGTEVDVLTRDESQGVHVDEADENELVQAMSDADSETGVSLDEAIARLPSLKRTA